MDQIELIEKRKPREKHFLQKDGTIRAEVYGEDIHYLKDGKYEEIDNSIVSEKSLLRNTQNDYKVEFNNDYKKSIMKISKNNYYIDLKIDDNQKFSLKENQRKVSKKLNNMISIDINDDLNIEHRVLSNKVKETIIIKQYIGNIIRFILDTNLILEKVQDEVYAYDNNHTIVFKIERPYIIDSSGLKSNNCTYSIKKEKNNCYLDLVLDDEWMHDVEREYPIYVDPTIINMSQTSGTYDTYIFPGDENTVRYDKPYLKAGVERINNSDLINRALIKFDLPNLATGDEVIFAKLNLTSYFTYTTNPKEYVATIHRLTSDWNESTATWNTMYNQFDSHIETLFKGTRSPIINNEIHISGNYCDGNITNLVKEWYKETPNYGIMIKSYNEVYVDDDFPAFYSKDNSYGSDNNPRPILEVQYRNQNGLENYLNYNTQNFSEGIGYVNTYNGNLTTVFNVGRTLGGNLPASLDIIYNTNDVILGKNTEFGNGIMSNYNQKISEVIIENDNYLSYLDEDGTTHYLKETTETNIFKDEDGLNIEVEKNNNSCIMSDSKGNSLNFTKNGDIYYLDSIHDSDNNIISIVYDIDNKIVSINDTYNNSISITYGNDNIVIDSPNSLTTLSYVNNKLYQISSFKGNTCFSYNSNGLLEYITDINGLKVKYEYYSSSPYKVKKVIQYGLNNTLGESFTLDYGFDSTKIIDNKNRCSTLIFNNYGNLLSTNNLSSEDELDNAYSIIREYGTNLNLKNRLLSNAIPFKSIRNILKNTSFENTTNYFTDSVGMSSSISSDYSNSGDNCLKCVSSGNNAYITQNVVVEKGNDYTFSGYFISDVNYIIEMSYYDNNNTIVTSNINCSSTTIFERNDVSIFYPTDATSNLIIKIILVSSGTLYMDDIQLENGKVANSYNIIDNSNFSSGFNDWNIDTISFDDSVIDINNYISSISFNNGKSHALKITGHPLKTFLLTKVLPIKGNEGDLYSFSFWFKNNGIPGLGPVYGTNVAIYFKPVGHDAEYCVPLSENLNVNKDKWQFFSYRSHAVEDFESIRISITVGREVNDFYITNLSFNKEITSGEYSYDTNGNLILIEDQSNNQNLFSYDSNNQLIKATNTMGKNYVYEYDKNKQTRVINMISSNGISNRIMYDQYGNPSQTKISKKYGSNIINGLYKIRSAGTNKYLKSELSLVLLEENECSNTIWQIEENTGKYKIKNSINSNFTISCDGNNVLLNSSNENNEFYLEKNDNNSYYIKYYEHVNNEEYVVKFLTANNNNTLEFKTYESNNNNNEFYIEYVDDIFIENNGEYSSNGKYIDTVTKSSLRKTKYNINPSTGLISSVIMPGGIETFYTYNNKKQITSLSQGNITITYNYNSNNMLSEIVQSNKSYNLSYDNFLNVTSIKINNSITLVSNEYENYNGNLIKNTYGNGNEVSFVYDIYDRISQKIKNNKIFTYQYDNNGNLFKIITNNNIKKYFYDKANRVYMFKNNQFSVNYSYNSENEIIQKVFKYNNNSHNCSSIFDEEKLLNMSLDNDTITYGYDNLNRVISKNIGNYIQYEKTFISNGRRTTNMIQDFIVNNDVYKYEYDSFGNIYNIYLNNVLIKKYLYDSYNELISEYNYDNNTIINYSYDLYGNITQKNIYNLSNNNIIKSYTYLYGNNNWQDQLTSFDGSMITYDNIGNMLSFEGKNLSWANGNELINILDNTNNISADYEYDDEGIRIKKIINNVPIDYYSINNNIIYEDRNGTIIYYLYDAEGLIGFQYNNQRYYYVKNMQDDIIGIIDESGNRVTTYYYDSWGNILGMKDSNNNDILPSNTSHIANINPFRYRSYYYDQETGLYYLNHRYYSPKLGRFISPDMIIGSNKDIFSNNLYCYVSNNPINNIDSNGCGLLNLTNLLLVKALAVVVTSKIISTAKKFIDSTLGKKLVNVSRSDSVDNSPPIKINNGYSTSTTSTSTVTKIGGGNKNAIINVTKEYNNFDLEQTSIESNLSFVNFGVGFSDNKVVATESFTIGNKSAKISLGMNNSYQFSFKLEYEHELSDNVYENISSEEEFSNYLTAFAVVVVGLCIAPLPALGAAKETVIPVFYNMVHALA